MDNLELNATDKEHSQDVLKKYNIIFKQYLQPVVDKMERDFSNLQKDETDSNYLSDMADLFSTAENALISSWICTEYQKWQQLIYLYILHEKYMVNRQIEKYTKDNTDNNIMSLKNLYGIDIESFDTWKKIDEMRLVVNVIKHFTGASYKNLKGKRPDLFKLYNEFDVNRMAICTSDFMLNLTSDDYFSYHDSLVKFWDELYLAINGDKIV